MTHSQPADQIVPETAVQGPYAELHQEFPNFFNDQNNAITTIHQADVIADHFLPTVGEINQGHANSEQSTFYDIQPPAWGIVRLSPTQNDGGLFADLDGSFAIAMRGMDVSGSTLLLLLHSQLYPQNPSEARVMLRSMLVQMNVWAVPSNAINIYIVGGSEVDSTAVEVTVQEELSGLRLILNAASSLTVDDFHQISVQIPARTTDHVQLAGLGADFDGDRQPITQVFFGRDSVRMYPVIDIDHQVSAYVHVNQQEVGRDLREGDDDTGSINQDEDTSDAVSESDDDTNTNTDTDTDTDTDVGGTSESDDGTPNSSPEAGSPISDLLSASVSHKRSFDKV